MNKSDLQTLTDTRVTDAKLLLDAGRFPAAYYLLGYAVECALKACIAKQIKEHDFPDKQLVLDSYTHNLEQLLRISGVIEMCVSNRHLMSRAILLGHATTGKPRGAGATATARD